MVKNEMRRWVASATAEELAQLAEMADTTVGTLRQLAGGYRNEGRAVTSSVLACSIERVTLSMTRPGLAPVLRGAISPACAGCDIYKQHKKHKK